MDFRPRRPTQEKLGQFETLKYPGERLMIEIGLVRLVQQVEQEHYDMLFFLDKSARPLAWGFKELWNLHHPETPAPEIRFINPPFHRSHSADPFDQGEFDAIYSDVRGKRVCLVDERAATGNSFRFIESAMQSPASDPAHVDRFEALSVWPSWYNTEPKIGVREKDGSERYTIVTDSRNDRMASSGLLTKRREAHSQAEYRLRRDMKRLAQHTERHFATLSRAITESHDPDTLKDIEQALNDEDMYTSGIYTNSHSGQPQLELPIQELAEVTSSLMNIDRLAIFTAICDGHIILQNDTGKELTAIEHGIADFRENPAMNKLAGYIERALA